MRWFKCNLWLNYYHTIGFQIIYYQLTFTLYFICFWMLTAYRYFVFLFWQCVQKNKTFIYWLLTDEKTRRLAFQFVYFLLNVWLCKSFRVVRFRLTLTTIILDKLWTDIEIFCFVWKSILCRCWNKYFIKVELLGFKIWTNTCNGLKN